MDSDFVKRYFFTFYFFHYFRLYSHFLPSYSSVCLALIRLLERVFFSILFFYLLVFPLFFFLFFYELKINWTFGLVVFSIFSSSFSYLLFNLFSNFYRSSNLLFLQYFLPYIFSYLLFCFTFPCFQLICLPDQN